MAPALVYNRERREKMGRNILIPVTSCAAICLFPACYQSESGLQDAARDDPSAEPVPDHTPDLVDDPLPDPVVEPEMPNPCPAGWTFASSADIVWCISPCRGTGNCCDAWEDCQLTGAFPGIWINAGPYNGVLPADFFEFMDLPGITMTFAAQLHPEGGIVANLSCFDRDGNKPMMGGESHEIPPSGDCSGEACEEYTKTEDCPDDHIGCGCDLPYWCHMEIFH
jgi:hypothetical protein